MLITVKGIVIGQRTVGENNCFIDVLTDEYGVIEAAAHGIKKLTSKNAGACSLFSMSTFCFAKTGTRYTLNSAEPNMSFYGVSADIERLALAAYFADVIKSTVSAEQEHDGFVRFMAVTLYELEKGRIPVSQIKSVFELHISAKLGFSPDLRACTVCACYEHEQMFFDYNESCIVCADCRDDFETSASDIMPLSASLLYTMRYIVFSPVDRIYRFTIDENTLAQLSELTEKYLLMQLDCKFRSLDYYHDIKL